MATEDDAIQSYKTVLSELSTESSTESYSEQAVKVFGGIDYNSISPLFSIFNHVENLLASLFQHNAHVPYLHLFFSLPTVGLSVKDESKGETVDEQIVEGNSTYSGLTNTTTFSGRINKTTGRTKLMNTILHYALPSPDSVQLSKSYFDSIFDSLNVLTKSFTVTQTQRFARVQPMLYTLSKNNKGAWEQTVIISLKDHLLNPIFQFYRSVSENSNTDEVPNYTFDGRQLMYEGCSVAPDIVFMKDSVNLVCFEVKYPQINIDFNSSEFLDVFTQSVFQCIAASTRYGAISDYFQTFFYIIDLTAEAIASIRANTENFRTTKTDRHYLDIFKYIKIQYYIASNTDSRYTLSSVTAAFLYAAEQELSDDGRRNKIKWQLQELASAMKFTEEEKLRQENNEYRKALIWADPNDSHASGFVPPHMGPDSKVESPSLPYCHLDLDELDYEVLQAGPNCNSQVFKIDKASFEKIVGRPARTRCSHFIMKIFDPVKGRRSHGEFRFTQHSYIKFSHKTFCKEAKIYDTLEHLQRRCIPRKYHAGYCELSFKDESISFGGFFLILEFLKGKQPDFSKKSEVASARRGLLSIHERMVAHGDIKKRNLLSCKNGIIFLDFGFSVFENQETCGRQRKAIKRKRFSKAAGPYSERLSILQNSDWRNLEGLIEKN